MAWNGDRFDIRLRDGTTDVFGAEAPLQAIRDRYGNTTTITRDPATADTDGTVRAKGPITRIASPNGKWIALSHGKPHHQGDGQHRPQRQVRVLGSRPGTWT